MTYLAAQFQNEPNLFIKNKENPPLQKNEILIKIKTATICGTDIQILSGNYDANPSVVLGHEYSGIIEQKGEEVKSLEIGDLVTVEPHIFCGLCKHCRVGKEHLCINKLAFGVHMDGGFAQYSTIPEKLAYKVPPSMTSTEAALTENIGCCLHGIYRADIQLGDTVLIIGGGFVGIILAELSKLQGAKKTIIIEPNEYRRKVIEKRGFTVLDPSKVNVEETLEKETNNLGHDVVIESAGKKETARQCFNYVGKGGTILFFGVVPPHETINVSPNTVYKKELRIVGSNINPFSHFRSLQIMDKLNLKELVTHHFPLNEINKAIETVKMGEGIKVAINRDGVEDE